MWDFSDTAMTFDNPAYLFDGTAPSPPPVITIGPGIGKSGGNAILDAKKANEIISFPFDFTSSLAANETIMSATADATVWSGVDTFPGLLVAQPAVIKGGIVYQPVVGGYEGVIYVISITANTSQNQTLEQDAFMTII